MYTLSPNVQRNTEIHPWTNLKELCRVERPAPALRALVVPRASSVTIQPGQRKLQLIQGISSKQSQVGYASPLLGGAAVVPHNL